MDNNFVSILRQPDHVFGATETTDYRFEETTTAVCDVLFDYRISGTSAPVTVYPSGSPVKYLKLRFSGNMEAVEMVGDESITVPYNFIVLE